MSLRLIKHFFAIAGGQLLNLVGNFLLPPLFASHWTVPMYGEWIALSSLTSYLSTLDMGVNSAVSNRLLTAYTRKDHEEYLRSQHSAAAFYLLLAVAGTLLTGLVVWLLPVGSWGGVKRSAVPDITWIVWLLGLQVLWMMPIGLLSNFYATIANPAKSKWLNNWRAVIGLFVTLIGLLLGCGMRTLAALQLLPMALVAVYVLWDMRRHFPQFLPGLSGAKLAIMRDLLKPSLMFAVIMVAMSLTQQGSTLMVSSLFGGIAVAVFATARTLTSSAMQMVRMIGTTAWPDLTILYAVGDLTRLRQLNRLVVTTSMTLCIAIAAALWFEGPSVVTVWMHHRVQVDPWFLRLLLLYLVLQSPWLANSNVTAAVNLHQKQAWSYLASGLLALGSMFALAPSLGLNAVPVGLIIGEALACYHFVIKDTCTVVGEAYGAYAARLWLGVAAVFGPALLAGGLAHQLAWGPPILRWSEVGLATLLVSCLMARCVWLGESDWSLLTQKAQAILAQTRARRLRQPA